MFYTKLQRSLQAYILSRFTTRGLDVFFHKETKKWSNRKQNCSQPYRLTLNFPKNDLDLGSVTLCTDHDVRTRPRLFFSLRHCQAEKRLRAIVFKSFLPNESYSMCSWSGCVAQRLLLLLLLLQKVRYKYTYQIWKIRAAWGSHTLSWKQ